VSGDALVNRSAGRRARSENWSASENHTYHRQGLVQVRRFTLTGQPTNNHCVTIVRIAHMILVSSVEMTFPFVAILFPIHDKVEYF
jgi:hypothetical protein